MFTYQLTINVLHQINPRRLSNNLNIIWPDYEIIDLLDQRIQHFHVHHYASTPSVISFPLGDKYQQVDQYDEYTHLACTKYQSKIIAVMSKRPIAIDKISFQSTKQLSINISVGSLSCQSYLWGCLAIPHSLTHTQGYAIVTPQNIVRNNQFLQFQIDQPHSPYEKLVFYGQNRQPRYGRKLYSAELSPNAYIIFQMNIRYYPSYMEQYLNPRTINLCPFLQPRSKNQPNKALANHSYQHSNQMRKNYFQQQYSKQNINSSNNQHDSPWKMIPFINNTKPPNHAISKWIDIYKRMISQPLSHQITIINNNFIEFTVNQQSLSRFKKKQHSSNILIQTYQPNTLNLFIKFISGITFNQIELIFHQQLIELLAICQELQLSIIPQIILLFGKFHLGDNQWIRLMLWITNHSIDQQVKQHIVDYILNCFTSNIDQYLGSLTQLAYVYLIEIPSQILVELVRRSLVIIDTSNVKALTQLLSILIRIEYAFNIVELVSFVSVFGDIVIRQYNQVAPNNNISIQQSQLIQIHNTNNSLKQTQCNRIPIVQKISLKISQINNLILGQPFYVAKHKFRPLTYNIFSKNEYRLTILVLLFGIGESKHIKQFFQIIKNYQICLEQFICSVKWYQIYFSKQFRIINNTNYQNVVKYNIVIEHALSITKTQIISSSMFAIKMASKKLKILS